MESNPGALRCFLKEDMISQSLGLVKNFPKVYEIKFYYAREKCSAGTAECEFISRDWYNVFITLENIYKALGGGGVIDAENLMKEEWSTSF